MRISGSTHDIETARPTRPWLVEALVVMGILAFGYFAVMIDPSAAALNTSAVDTPDPLVDLFR